MAPTPATQSIIGIGLAARLPTVKASTLSRVAVDNPAVRVIMFSLDEGQELTDHTEPTPEVWTVLEGQVRFTVDGQTSELTAGDVIYLAPGAQRALIATSPARLQHVVLPS